MKQTYMLMADYYHPDDVLRPGMKAAFGDEGYVYCNDPAEIPWETLSDVCDLLVIAKMDDFSSQVGHPRYDEIFAPIADWMNPDRAASLEKFVAEGGGFLAIHSGILWHEDDPTAKLTGGYFLRHPPQCDVTVVPFAKHPITEGVETFTAKDEFYMCRVYADEVTPLCASYSAKPVGEPAVISGWCKEYGKGRVVALCPGHTIETICNPNMTRLIQNSAKWATR
jgi:type 1 glutamine amidotransferase